jgi:hypothetical protein
MELLVPQGYQKLRIARILHTDQLALSRLRLKRPMVHPAAIPAPRVASGFMIPKDL